MNGKPTFLARRFAVMPIRTVVLVFLCIVAAVFLILNWPGITAPVPVNLLYTDTEAPLGLILLLVLGVLWIAGIIWALLQQAATLLEIRKAYKEADSSRGLADSAEKSRFEESKKAFHEELAALEQKFADTEAQNIKDRDAFREKLLTQIVALQSTLAALDVKIDAVAEKNGVEFKPAAPADKKAKSGFFGFLGHREKEPAKPIMAVEKTPVKELPGNTGTAEKEQAQEQKR